MLLQNSLIKFVDSTTERVLFIEQGDCYMIDVFSNKMPVRRTVEEIEALVLDGKAVLLEEDPYSKLVLESELSVAERNGRDVAWSTIKEIVGNEPAIYYSKDRRKMIEEQSAKHEIHPNTINRYLKRFWVGGKVKNALIPAYANSGAKGKERNIGDSKRGRPRKNPDLFGAGINVDDATKAVFRKALNKYYYTKNGKSIQKTYILMLRDAYAVDTYIKDGVEIPRIDDADKLPTIDQFRYFFKKENSLKKEVVTRKSTKLYDQKNKMLLGNSTYEVYGPNHIVEADATLSDLYLCSRFDRESVIGRANVVLIKDVYTRLITGFYVGLEQGWTSVMMALANVVEDKVEFCKKYGIDIEEEMWPSNIGLPQTILADRGEFFAKENGENIINNLSISLQNTPPYSGQNKGIIEKALKDLQEKYKSFTPGTIDSEVRKRGDRDYRLDATLDLYQFTQMIIKIIIHHNNYHILEDYKLEPQMIEDGLIEEITPVSLWTWGVKNRSGLMKKIDKDIVRLNLMPSGKGRVSSRGLLFKGMLYSSSSLMKRRIFERNNGSGKNTVKSSIEIKYDPRNAENIYIISEDGMSYEKCFLLEHQSRYKNLSLKEVEYLFEYEKIQKQKSKSDMVQQEVSLYTEIEDIIESAKQMKYPNTKSKSKAERLRNIRENRAFEKTVNRVEEAFVLGEEEEQNKESAKVIEHPKSKRKSISEMLEEQQQKAFERMLKK